MYADKDYIISLRREIHEYPEIGFDLPKTIAIVKRELDALGIEYTEKYGESSVVAILNPKGKFTIGIRADMDALLIDEKTDLPFKSKIKGQMHACGHDAHTAMLLGTAKALKSMEDTLTCRVMLVFQPSEEGIRSGAAELVEGGLMEEIDVIIGMHIENWLDSGKIGVCAGSSMASSRNFRLDFHGKTAHATLPHTGADALAAAIRTYNNIQYMLSREINPFSKYVCSIGRLEGGTTQNVVADRAFMLGTIRTFDMELDAFLIRRIEEIAKNTAGETGVEAVLDTSLKAFVVYNNPYISSLILKSAEKTSKGIQKMPEKLSSEDFSQYLTKKPGAFIRLGTRNPEKGCTTLPHNNDFMIDEDAFAIGSDTCIQFVLDNMNGIDMNKVEESDERKNKR
ncbi:MAG: amidohydrolase [Ruminococcaceae bacterium]|nr:amidohydrolase [Oscillospiraceae bacterium]